MIFQSIIGIFPVLCLLSQSQISCTSAADTTFTSPTTFTNVSQRRLSSVTNGVNTSSSLTTTGMDYETTTIKSVKKLDTRRCRTGPIPEKPYIEPCCDYYYERFALQWTFGDNYLTTNLDKFQRWNCKQFETECESPTFAFTEYTKLVYDRFCDRTNMENRCMSPVKAVIEKYDFMDTNRSRQSSWIGMVGSLKPNQIDMQDLVIPCIQIALFDRKDGGVGRFHEIIEPYVPYCGLQWNGFDYETTLRRSVSPWTTLHAGCRSGIVIGMIIMALGSLITIFCNTIILVVFGTTKKLQNSQGTYKMSLAIADLMIGIIVWPNMIAMQYLTFFTPRSMGDVIKRPYVFEGSKFPYDNPNLTYRYSGGSFKDIFPLDYLQSMGFFSNLGIVLSVYTLMLASVDRLFAISMPLKYSRHKAAKFAKISCIVLWFLSFIIAVLPIFIDGLRYQALSSILISPTGTPALVLSLIGLVLPLIVTIILSILTFMSSRGHARNRLKIMAVHQTNEDFEKKLEKQLAKTLTLMVGAFTLSVLSPIACTMAGLVSSSITWSDPRNLAITSANAYTTSEYLSVILLSTNSIWNFFIYNWRNRCFQDAVKSLLKKTSTKPGFRQVHLAGRHAISAARSAGRYTTVTVRRYSSAFSFATKSNKTATQSADNVNTSTFRQRSSLDSVEIVEGPPRIYDVDIKQQRSNQFNEGNLQKTTCTVG